MATVSAARPIRCDHGQRRGEIVDSLVAEVCRGELQAGQRLVTDELARRFGVSHTPIREALIALAGIGIIELVPNRGAIVKPVTQDDIREICEVRRALECEAVRRACGQMDKSTLQELQRDLNFLLEVDQSQRADHIQMALAVDSRLHDSIAQASGNQLLVNELGRLKTLFHAFRDLAWRHDESHTNLERMAEEAVQHLAIVEALIEQQRGTAARAMSRHIMTGVKYWGRALPKTNGRAAAGSTALADVNDSTQNNSTQQAAK